MPAVLLLTFGFLVLAPESREPIHNVLNRWVLGCGLRENWWFSSRVPDGGTGPSQPSLQLWLISAPSGCGLDHHSHHGEYRRRDSHQEGQPPHEVSRRPQEACDHDIDHHKAADDPPVDSPSSSAPLPLSAVVRPDAVAWSPQISVLLHHGLPQQQPSAQEWYLEPAGLRPAGSGATGPADAEEAAPNIERPRATHRPPPPACGAQHWHFQAVSGSVSKAQVKTTSLVSETPPVPP